MTQALQTFSNPEFGNMRTVNDFNNPRFCLADECKILGIGNPSQVKTRLDKGVISNETLETAGGMQTLVFINEDGLYDLILDSRKPAAKKFRKWITSEVIPSIRRHGVYATNDFLSKSIADPTYAIGILTALKEMQDKAAALEAKNAELQPKADFYDRFLNSDETMPITYIAKMYGKSGKEMNKLLAGLKTQYRVGKRWVLYQEHADKGYTRAVTTLVNGRITTHTEWTNRGRLFIYNQLKEIGIVPESEREERQLQLFEEARS